MKISKKNLEWAYRIDRESIAAELQKRDDKIKALRAEIKQLRAELTEAEIQDYDVESGRPLFDREPLTDITGCDV